MDRDGKLLTQDVTPRVQTPMEFLADFQKEAQKATKRIWLKAMCMEDGQATGSIAKILTHAVQRGVDVRVDLDWFTTKSTGSYVVTSPFLNRAQRERIKHIRATNRDLLNRLIKAGVKVGLNNCLGRIGDIFPQLTYVKRDHRKSFIVDDIAWIGGMNLSDVDFNRLDLVVKIENNCVVSAVAEQFTAEEKRCPLMDQFIECDRNYSLLMDCGKVGKSIIYKEAIQMVQSVNKQIIYVSQVVPDGPLLETILSQARRGIPVKLLTSREESYKIFFPFKLALKNYQRKAAGVPNIQLFYDVEGELHAKLLLVDQEALFGSHNFTRLSILAGTEEIALHSRDLALINQLYEFTEKLSRQAKMPFY